MKREIKFKGKRLDNGEWVYGDLGITENTTFIMGHSLDKVDPETVGQYTGLKDRNGKEIYEGDIVKAPLLDPILFDVLADAFCEAEIKFNNAAFVVSYYKQNLNIYFPDLQDKIEVIGNIYDNPGLIEVK